MKVPGYPSNREADESAMETTAKAGRYASKMMLSRETCLHREINHSPGGGICYWAEGLFAFAESSGSLFGVPQGGRFFFLKKHPLADSFDQK